MSSPGASISPHAARIVSRGKGDSITIRFIGFISMTLVRNSSISWKIRYIFLHALQLDCIFLFKHVSEVVSRTETSGGLVQWFIRVFFCLAIAEKKHLCFLSFLYLWVFASICGSFSIILVAEKIIYPTAVYHFFLVLNIFRHVENS